MCYTLWLEGSDPAAEAYEAYANVQPALALHDGTTYVSTQPGAIQLLNTQRVTPASFASIV